MSKVWDIVEIEALPTFDVTFKLYTLQYAVKDGILFVETFTGDALYDTKQHISRYKGYELYKTYKRALFQKQLSEILK